MGTTPALERIGTVAVSAHRCSGATRHKTQAKTDGLLLVYMVIHFICRGNTHRSRIAEAYAKSFTLDISDITVLSSGIEADHDLNGPIVPFVKLLLQNENLLEFAATSWTQTTQRMIDDSDVLVFINVDVYKDAIERLAIPLTRSQTWQISDTQGVNGQIRSAVKCCCRSSKVHSRHSSTRRPSWEFFSLFDSRVDRRQTVVRCRPVGRGTTDLGSESFGRTLRMSPSLQLVASVGPASSTRR